MTLEVVPFGAYAPLPALLPILMHSGSYILWGGGCSAPPTILPWSPQICQIDSFSILSSIEETEESRMGGLRQSRFWSKNSLMTKEVWDDALSWRNGQFFRRQSSGRSLRTFWRSRRKTTQYYEELTLWPLRTNSLKTDLSMSKKMIGTLFTSPFACLFGLSIYGSCFLIRMFV
jgi:hypothetical protein